jgi:hypothetical protein
MNDQGKERKFKDFIVSLSSAIVMTIMFGIVAIVLIYDAVIGDIAALPLSQMCFLIIVLSIVSLIGSGYIITMLLRIENKVSNIEEKKD